MSTKTNTCRDIQGTPGNQLFPATTNSLVCLIGIILLTFSLSLLVFFAY